MANGYDPIIEKFQRQLFRIYYRFSSERELEAVKLASFEIPAGKYGTIKTHAYHYENEIEKAFKSKIPGLFRRYRFPDLFIFVDTKHLRIDKSFFPTLVEDRWVGFFVELGVSDRYYFWKKRLAKNAPPIKHKDLFNQYIDYLKKTNNTQLLKRVLAQTKPKKSTKPRMEGDKMKYFRNPIPNWFVSKVTLSDIKKGNVRKGPLFPVYFGYFFSDDVLLLQSMLEIKETATVKTEVVNTSGGVARSENYILDITRLKPLPLVVFEVLFGKVATVKYLSGEPVSTNYKVTQLITTNWKRFQEKRKVSFRPKNPEETLRIFAS